MATNTRIGVSLEFKADTSQAIQQMNSLKTQLNNIMSIGTGSMAPGAVKLTSDLQAAQQSAAALKTSLDAAFNINTGKLDLTKFQRSLQMTGTSLKQLQSNLAAMGPTGQQAFSQLAMSIATAETPMLHLGSKLKSLLSGFASIARYQISTRMFSAIVSGLQEALNYSKELNESLNNIRIVTGYSVEEMDKFAEKANKAAKALSTTTTAMTDAALIYFQQGLNMEEAQKRAEVTVKMANVTGASVQDMSDHLTAVWNNFDNGSKSLEHYADVLTALGAATASSTEEITTGLEKFAAIAETVGLSYEYATTALATVTATTRQSAEVVGTAFKTLFARIQDLELGKTLDDGVTLGKYSEALNVIGVNILDDNNNLREMNDILDDMGAKWGSLTDAQKTATAQTVAGIRQYTQLIALMDNWDYFQENLQVAEGSEGTLQKQQDTYAESWEAASQRVKAAWEEIYEKLFDDSSFIKLTNIFADFISLIDKITDSMGGLKGILLTVSTLLINVYQRQLASAIDRAQVGVNNTINTLTFGKAQLGKTQAQQNGAGFQEEARNLAVQQYGTSPMGQVQSKTLDSMISLSQKYMAEKKNMNEAEQAQYELLLKQNEAQVEKISLQAEAAKSARQEANATASMWKQGEYSVKEQYRDEKGRFASRTRDTTEDVKNILNNNYTKTGEQAFAAQSFSQKMSQGYTDKIMAAGMAEGPINKKSLQAAATEAQNLKKIFDEMGISGEQLSQIYGDKMAQAMQKFSQATTEVAEKQDRINQLKSKQEANTATEDEIFELEMLNGKYDEQIQKIEAAKKAREEANLLQKTADGARAGAGKDILTEKAKTAQQKAQTAEEEAKKAESQMDPKALEKYNNMLARRNTLSAQGKKLTKEEQAELNRLNSTLKSQPKAVREAAKAQEGMGQAAESSMQSYTQLKNQLKNLGVPEAQLEGLEQKMKEAGISMDNASLDSAEFRAKLAELGISIDNLNAKPITFGQRITAAASMMSGLGMALSSFKGLWDTLNNEDATFFEKLISVMTTLGMIIPMVTTSMSAQNLVRMFGINLQKTENGITMTGVASKLAMWIATKLLGAEKVTETTAVWANNVAWYASPLLWIPVIIMAAVAAIAALVYGIVQLTKAIDNRTPLEKAKDELADTEETLEKFNETLEESKTKLEEVKNILDEYEEVQNSFEELTKGSEAWNEALQKNNELVNQLIKEYPELAQYIEYDNGIATLPSWARQYAQGRATQEMLSDSIAANEANVAVKKAQLEVDLEKNREEQKKAWQADTTATGHNKIVQDITEEGYQQYTLGNKQYIRNYENEFSWLMENQSAYKFQSEIASDTNLSAFEDNIFQAFKKASASEKGLNEENFYEEAIKTLGWDKILEHNPYAKELEEAGVQNAESFEDLTQTQVDLLKGYWDQYAIQYENYLITQQTLTNEEIRLKQEYLALEKALYESTAASILSYQSGYSTLSSAEQEAAIALVGNDLRNKGYNEKYSNSEDNYTNIIDIAQKITGKNYDDSEDGTRWHRSKNKNNNDVAYRMLNSEAGQDILNTYLEEAYGSEYSYTDLERKDNENLILKTDEEEIEINTEDILKDVYSDYLYNTIDYQKAMSMAQSSPTLAAGLSGNYMELSTSEASNIGLNKEGQIVDENRFQSHVEEVLGALSYTQEELDAVGLIWDEATNSFISNVQETGQELSETGKEILAQANTIASNAKEYNQKDAEASQNRQDQAEANALIAESAEKYDLNTEALERYAQEIKDANKETKMSAKAAAQVAIANARYTKGIEKLQKSLEDNEESLQKWVDTGELTYETAEQVAEVAEALTDIFGVEVSNSFIKENYELIKQLSKGGEEALEAMQLLETEAAKDYIANLYLDSDIETQLNGIIDKVQGLEGNHVMGMSLDDSATIESLNKMLADGKVTAEQVQAAFNAIGWTPTITKRTEYVTSTSYSRSTTAGLFSGNTDAPENIQNWGGGRWTKIETRSEMQIPEIGDVTYTPKTETSVSSPPATTSSGGGGGSSKTTKKVSDEKERYHEIKEVIDDLTREYDRLSDAKDRAFGPDKLAYLDQEIAKQQELIKAQKEYLSQIEKNLDLDRAELAQHGASFDEYGRVTNYDELIEDAVNKYNAGELSDEGYENFMKTLEQYEETLNLLEEEQDALIEQQNKIADMRLEKIEIAIEFELKIEDDALAFLEYQLGKLDDDIDDIAKSLALLGEQTETYLNKSEIYTKGIRDILTEVGASEEQIAAFMAGNSSALDGLQFTEAQMDLLLEYRDGLLETNEALLEMRNTVFEKVTEAFEKMNEELDKSAEKFDFFNSILSSYKDIIDIVGKDTLGIADEMIESLGKASVNNAANSVAAARSILEANERALAEARAAYTNATTEEDKEKWLETIETIEESTREAQENLMSSWTDALQTAADEFEASMERITDAFGEALAGAAGSLDSLQQMFEQQTEISERYVQDYAKIYELSKLNRDINKSINDTDSVAAKKALREMEAEVLAMQESGVELSQHDLDYMRKKYELRLAEIALEEAQNAKNQVRMTRDSEGNWSYTYVADEEKLDQAQQAYEDKLYEMQNFEYERINELQDLIVQAYSDFQNAINDLQGKNLSPEEYRKELKKLQQYYGDQQNYYYDELQKALGNSNSLYNNEWMAYSNLTGYKISADEKWMDSFDETILSQITGYDSLTEAQNNFHQSTEEMITSLIERFEEYHATVEEIFEAAGSSVEGFAEEFGIAVKDISEKSDEASEATEDMAQNMSDSFANIIDDAEQWLNDYSEIINNSIAKNDTWIESINEMVANYKSAVEEINNNPINPQTNPADVQETGGTKGGEGPQPGPGPGEVEEEEETTTWWSRQGKTIQDYYYNLYQKFKKEASYNMTYSNGKAIYRGVFKSLMPSDNQKIIYTAYQVDPQSAIAAAKNYLDIQWRNLTQYWKGEGYDTGGYTGSWDNSGRLAMLHQKELVLNASDTENFLSAVGIIREIASAIDLGAVAQSLNLSSLSAVSAMPIDQSLEQEVTIHAEFPNATNRSEIEEAFDSLLNRASQFANRKK